MALKRKPTLQSTEQDEAGQQNVDDEIQSVMTEEKNRGTRRKRVDTEERKKIQRTKADVARVLASGDERAFMKIMREIRLNDDSPEFVNALKTFRDHAKRR